IRIAWVFVRIGKSVAVIEKELHGFDGNRETESLAKSDLHVRDPHDFAGKVKQRPTAVPGIDLRRGLQIKLAAKLPRFSAQDAFGHGAFENERTADSKDAFAHGERVGVAHEHIFKFWSILIFNFE